MRLLIFGAGGFIGSHLVKEAGGRGDEVIALSRSGFVRDFSGAIIKWEFAQPLPEAVLQPADCAIHLAHDFYGAEGAEKTVNSTMECISLLRRAGVKRQLFFSSYSAGGHATSLYGRSKFAIEKGISDFDDIVIVRPGLVLGDAGIYGRISKLACILPIIPLPDGGRGQVPVITIERLCQETLVLAQAIPFPHEANLFERDFRSLRQLVEEAAMERGGRPLILPIPSSWMISCLKVADFFRVSLPVNTDNLQGFLSNQRAEYISSI